MSLVSHLVQGDPLSRIHVQHLGHEVLSGRGDQTPVSARKGEFTLPDSSQYLLGSVVGAVRKWSVPDYQSHRQLAGVVIVIVIMGGYYHVYEMSHDAMK